ncbi:MAG: MerR family transcriptional regulator [Eubacteriales bacterium]|nr:MerR family transcriptional regulator [Eubacteriales bacterium]
MENNELFQIGEVSRLFHISVSILRHYDKIGLVKPEYTDPDTGYRYYSARQFECLNTIRYLRALDMPLEQISRFLQNRDIDTIHEMLLRQKDEVKRRQQELALIEHKIDNRLGQIRDALASELNTVTIVHKPPRRLASLRKKVTPKTYLDLEYSIRQLESSEDTAVTFLGKVGIGISRENLIKKQFQPYDIVFIILDKEDHFKGTTILLPEETCVCIRFQGGHEKAAHYYELLMDYIKKKGGAVSGFSKEITMIDYGLTNDTSKFVTEIQIPVEFAEPSA